MSENKTNLTTRNQFLIVCGLAAAIILIISLTYAWFAHCTGKGFNTDGAMLDTLTALIAVCATIIVGLQIFNSMEFRNYRKEVDDDMRDHRKEKSKLEEQAKMLEEQTKTLEEQTKTLEELAKYAQTNVDRIDGDHSRTTAFMLLEAGKPTWAMGWACRAIKSYDRAYELYPVQMDKSYPSLIQQLITIEVDCIKSFRNAIESDSGYSSAKSDADYKSIIVALCGRDNREDGKAVLRRTYKDVVDSRIVVQTRSDVLDMQESDSQREVLETYTMLLTSVVTDSDVDYAHRSSRYKLDFPRTVEAYRKANAGKSVKDIFDALTTALS